MIKILQNSPIIPIITVNGKSDAFELAAIFSRHGIKTLEVTMRAPNALAIINALAMEFPDMIIGAGTITRVNLFEQILASKAQFAVSPGFLPEVAAMAKVYSRSYLPGVSTVSEAMQAQAAGFSCLKLFPAQLSGGVELIKTISTVLPKLRFCPSGGINLENYADYLALDNVVSVGMSALAPQQLIVDKDWKAIDSLCASLKAPRTGRGA